MFNELGVQERHLLQNFDFATTENGFVANFVAHRNVSWIRVSAILTTTYYNYYNNIIYIE